MRGPPCLQLVRPDLPGMNDPICVLLPFPSAVFMVRSRERHGPIHQPTPCHVTCLAAMCAAPCMQPMNTCFSPRVQVATFELNACLSLLFFTLAGERWGEEPALFHLKPFCHPTFKSCLAPAALQCCSGCWLQAWRPRSGRCAANEHARLERLVNASTGWDPVHPQTQTQAQRFAGWWGLVVAGIAWYIAAADVINEQFKVRFTSIFVRNQLQGLQSRDLPLKPRLAANAACSAPCCRWASGAWAHRWPEA